MTFQQQTILTITGTRPEAIKMAPVIKQLAACPGRVRSVVCATGQHREMLDQVMGLFGLRADYDLNVMKPGQTLSGLTANLFTGLDQVVRECNPDWVLAQGDTTTVFVSGVVTYYHGVRFGHVEAGLRTGDRRRPFPEEINRRIADVVADAYFAPTQRARENLLREGIDDRRIFVTGNTVVDALLDISHRPFDWSRSALAGLERQKRIVLVTAHRRESFGEPFRELCEAILKIALLFERDGVSVVYPVHLNPNVRKPVTTILSGISNIHLIEPCDYLCMVHLMKHATLILTDSGGIQEEAPSLGVPVLVMRDTTERPEGLDAGVVKLVGTSRERIVSEAAALLTQPELRTAMAGNINPYGDGHAARRIVDAILNWRE